MSEKINYLKLLAVIMTISILYPIIVLYGNEYTLELLKIYSDKMITFIVAPLVVIIGILTAGVAGDEEDKKFDKILNSLCIVILFFGVLIVSCMIPALIIYLILDTNNSKIAIKIATLILSAIAALILYLNNKKDFQKPSEKLSLFSAVFVPVSVITYFI